MALRAAAVLETELSCGRLPCLGAGAPLDLIMKDGLLAGTKIMAEGMDTAALYKNRRTEKAMLCRVQSGIFAGYEQIPEKR